MSKITFKLKVKNHASKTWLIFWTIVFLFITTLFSHCLSLWSISAKETAKYSNPLKKKAGMYLYNVHCSKGSQRLWNGFWPTWIFFRQILFLFLNVCWCRWCHCHVVFDVSALKLLRSGSGACWNQGNFAASSPQFIWNGGPGGVSQPRALRLGLFASSSGTFDPIWTPTIQTVLFAHNGAESWALPQIKSCVSGDAVSRNLVIAFLESQCI